MRPTLTFLAVAAALALAPPAHAALVVGSNAADTSIVVTGDDSSTRLFVRDGDSGGGNAFAFYTQSNEPVGDPEGICVHDVGGGPFDIHYCGNNTYNKAVFNLGGGNDNIQDYATAGGPFTVLRELVVDFGPGNDTNEGDFREIPSTLRGGDGNDFLGGYEGTPSNVEGGPGDDRLVGNSVGSGETLRGGPGNDDINGLEGNDAIFGDEGNDLLTGGAQGDTITGGPGADDVRGDDVPPAFSGSDTIFIADGERDTATCGFGADTVQADGVDLIPDLAVRASRGPGAAEDLAPAPRSRSASPPR